MNCLSLIITRLNLRRGLIYQALMTTPKIKQHLLWLGLFALFAFPIFAQPNDPISQNRSQERLHQALYHIHAQAQLTGWTSELNRLAGDIYAQMGDVEHAVAYWQRANFADPARLELLVAGYVQLQQWDFVIITLNRLLSIAPTHESGLWQWSAITILDMDDDTLPLAKARLEQIGNSPEFGTIAQSLLSVLDSDYPIYKKTLAIGLILGSVDRWDLAELAFEQANEQHILALVGSNGSLEQAYIGLARYMQSKPAQTWFDRALQLDPSDDQIYYLYGLYARGTGDLETAKQAFINSISLNSGNPAYYIELGITYYALSDIQQGDYWIKFAQTIGGDSETIQRIIDDFYAEQQSAIFDFDALQALLDATPESTPEITPEVTIIP